MAVKLSHEQKDSESLKTISISDEEDPEPAKIDDEIIQQLSNANIISEEQWTVFVNTFNKVYFSFIKDIKGKHPDITFTKMRYWALSNLDLSTRGLLFSKFRVLSE